METSRLALPKGFRLENYELTGVLGKGGFGITYLGLDLHLQRKVAIKELLPDSIATRVDGTTVVAQSEALEENWEWAKERFVEEARVLAGFQHPNIVGVHRIMEANGTVYMVMDHIDGESYEARLRRIGREPDEAAVRAVLEPLLTGLSEVHRAGLLHRDIKPDNILFRRGGEPVLLDFGSARESVGRTVTMTSIVTHGYSPVEQYQTKGKQGPWSDIYALGAVVVRAITGEKPPVAVDRLAEDEFLWLSNCKPAGFSTPFLHAVDWALRVKAGNRPQSIAEWRAVLAGEVGSGERVAGGSGTAKKPEKTASATKCATAEDKKQDTAATKSDETLVTLEEGSAMAFCVLIMVIIILLLLITSNQPTR